MLEWVGFPAKGLGDFLAQVRQLPGLSPEERQAQILIDFQEAFPRSHFQVFEKGKTSRGRSPLRKVVFSAHFSVEDLQTKAPRWFPDSQDATKVWDEMTQGFRASVLAHRIEVNYLRNQPQFFHFVMRNYALSRPPTHSELLGAFEAEEIVYNFDLKGLRTPCKQTDEGLQLSGGLLLTAETFLPPESLLYLEALVEVIEGWLNFGRIPNSFILV